MGKEMKKHDSSTEKSLVILLMLIRFALAMFFNTLGIAIITTWNLVLNVPRHAIRHGVIQTAIAVGRLGRFVWSLGVLISAYLEGTRIGTVFKFIGTRLKNAGASAMRFADGIVPAFKKMVEILKVCGLVSLTRRVYQNGSICFSKSILHKI
jgi:hypothetical protein